MIHEKNANQDPRKYAQTIPRHKLQKRRHSSIAVLAQIRTGKGGVDGITGWPEGWTIGATEGDVTTAGWVVVGVVTVTGGGVSFVGTMAGCCVVVVGVGTGGVEGGAVGVITITG